MSGVEAMREALVDLIVTHDMWIDDDGNDLDYSPDREARIGAFIDEAMVVVAEEVTAACEAAALAIERNGKVCRDAHGPNCVGHAAYTDAAYLARAAAPPSSIGSGVGGQGGVGL